VLLAAILPQKFLAIAGGIVLGVGLGLVVLEVLFQGERGKQPAASVREVPQAAEQLAQGVAKETKKVAASVREVPQAAEQLAQEVAEEAKKVVSLVRRKTRSQAERGKSAKKDTAA